MKQKEFSTQQILSMIDKADAADRRRKAYGILAGLVAFLIIVLVVSCAAQPVYAAEFPGLRADYEAQKAKADLSGVADMTLIVYSNGGADDKYKDVLRIYTGCTNLGEYNSADLREPPGYAQWTCEQWQNATSPVPRRQFTAVRYGLIVQTDGETYINCALVESGWNSQGRYGFRSYDCR